MSTRALLLLLLACGFVQGYVYAQAAEYQEFKQRLSTYQELHRVNALTYKAYFDMPIKMLVELES